MSVATTDMEKVGQAVYVAYHLARGHESVRSAWGQLDKVGRRPWIEAGEAALRETNVRVPIAIELLTLEPGLAEKLIRHGYGELGEQLPVAILMKARKRVSCETEGES